MSDKKKKYPVEIWYANAKVVLNDGDYAQIKNGFDCAIAIDSDQGAQFFICQKIFLNDGSEYNLERYDIEKQTVFYRRRK